MDGPSNRDNLRHMTPHPPPKHRSPLRKAGHWLRNALATMLIAATAFLVAGLVYDDPRVTGLLGMDSGTYSQSEPLATAPVQQTEAAGVARPADTPPPGLEESDAPLGVPELLSVTSQSYKFLVVNDDGSPVGYSPCRPLHYVVNETLAPEGAAHLVHDAIRTIASATGITFIHDGETAEEPSGERDPYQPGTYGDRWAPLLISWTTPEAAPKLKGQVIGTGGSTHYSFNGGPKSFVTGSLELDAPQIDLELERPDGAQYATAVILHELGHVMGLEHVDDPVQLMYPEIGTPDGLAAGDLSGLRELGQTQCRKDL
jgi:hypothetical protein